MGGAVLRALTYSPELLSGRLPSYHFLATFNVLVPILFWSFGLGSCVRNLRGLLVGPLCPCVCSVWPVHVATWCEDSHGCFLEIDRAERGTSKGHSPVSSLSLGLFQQELLLLPFPV